MSGWQNHADIAEDERDEGDGAGFAFAEALSQTPSIARHDGEHDEPRQRPVNIILGPKSFSFLLRGLRLMMSSSSSSISKTME